MQVFIIVESNFASDCKVNTTRFLIRSGQRLFWMLDVFGPKICKFVICGMFSHHSGLCVILTVPIKAEFVCHVYMETHAMNLEGKLHCCIGFRSYSNWICAYENIARGEISKQM